MSRSPAGEGCLALLGGNLGVEGDLAHPGSSPGLQQQGTPATPQRATGRVHLPSAVVRGSLTSQSVCSILRSWWWDSGNAGGLPRDRQESVCPSSCFASGTSGRRGEARLCVPPPSQQIQKSLALLLRAWLWLVTVGDLNRKAVTPESPPAAVRPQQRPLPPCTMTNAHAALQM